MGSVRFFQPLTYTKEASAAMAVASNEFMASTPWPPACRHWWQSTVLFAFFRKKGSGNPWTVITVRSAVANARRRRPLCRFIVIAVGLSLYAGVGKRTLVAARAGPQL